MLWLLDCYIKEDFDIDFLYCLVFLLFVSVDSYKDLFVVFFF